MSQETVQSTVKVIKLSDILTLMAEGKTRKEINALYGETDAAMKLKVWNHPKLKNKKSAKPANITLEDDTEEAEETTTQEVVETVAAPIEEEAGTQEAPVAEETTTEQEQETVTETVEDAPAVEDNVATQDIASSAPQTEAPATQRGTW